MRIEYYDRIKGMAILLVISGHVIQKCLGLHDSLNTFITTFHMPLFMFMSGMFFSPPPSPSKFLHRILRYIVPFLLIGPIYSYYINSSWERFIMNGAKMGYWYLFVLAIFYVIMSLTQNVKLKHSIIYDVITILCVWAGFLWGNKQIVDDQHDPLSFNYCTTLWLYFCGGFFIRKYNREQYLYHSYAYTLALITFIGILVIYPFHFIGYRTLMSISAIILIFCLFKQFSMHNGKIWKMLSICGRSSLDLYIYHYFFLSWFKLKDLGIWLEDTNNLAIEIAAVIIVVVIIAMMSCFIGWLLKNSHLIKRFLYF